MEKEREFVGDTEVETVTVKLAVSRLELDSLSEPVSVAVFEYVEVTVGDCEGVPEGVLRALRVAVVVGQKVEEDVGLSVEVSLEVVEGEGVDEIDTVTDTVGHDLGEDEGDSELVKVGERDGVKVLEEEIDTVEV